MEIYQVGVVGAGTMGAGIAQTAAAAGYQVLLYDVDGAAVERALTQVTSRMAHEVRKDRRNQDDSDALLRRLKPCDNLAEFARVQYVIEAATEKMEVKKDLFRRLDSVCRSETVLATNTSGMSITEIASATERPDLVIGTHYFNPVPVMKLVEIIRGQDTSEDAVEVAMQVCTRMGKECIDVKEAPLVRRQPNSCTHAQRSGVCIAGRPGERRGHRYWYDAWGKPPHWSARACGHGEAGYAAVCHRNAVCGDG